MKMAKASNNRKRGKEFERYLADVFGGHRMGLLGGEDVMHDVFSIEAKCREKFTARKFMDQCVRNNKRHKIPLVVVHENHKAYDTSLVVIQLNDFLELLNARDTE